MEGYFANTEEEGLLPEQEENTLWCYFAGNDFQQGYSHHPLLFHFKNEFLKDVRIIKRKINQQGITQVVFTGGEPLLQKQALVTLSRYAKKHNKKTILETHATKPEVLHYLLHENLIDEIHLMQWFSIDLPHFTHTTKAGSFFYPPDAVLKDYKKSLMLLKEKNAPVIMHLFFHDHFLLQDAVKILEKFQPQQIIFHSHCDRFYPALSLASPTYYNDAKQQLLQFFPDLIIEDADQEEMA